MGERREGRRMGHVIAVLALLPLLVLMCFVMIFKIYYDALILLKKDKKNG